MPIKHDDDTPTTTKAATATPQAGTIANPNAALVDQVEVTVPPVARAAPTHPAPSPNPHASPVAPPVEGEEALYDPTPIARQGAEVIPPSARTLEPTEQAMEDARAAASAPPTDEDESVSRGEKVRRAARER